MNHWNFCIIQQLFIRKNSLSSKFWIKFDGRFRVTSLTFFVPDFNLISGKLGNFTLRVLYWVILLEYYFKVKSWYLSRFFWKIGIFLFLLHQWKNLNIAISIYISSKINLLYCFWSASGFCCLIKSIAIS